MAKPVSYLWTPAYTDTICAPQAVIADTPMVLNGSLANTAGGVASSVYFSGISRTVSVLSTDAGDTMDFTITGMLRGISVSETIIATGINSAYGAQFFDSISSVIPNADSAGDISIGSGITGYTHWFKHDYNTAVANTAVQVFAGAANTTYSFQGTLFDVGLLGTSEPDGAYLFTMMADMTDATGSALDSVGIPLRYSRIYISDCTTFTADDYLEIYYLQQGI
jgi:hypothetical protein